MLRLQLSILLIIFLVTGIDAQTIYEHSDTSRFLFSYKPYIKSSNNNVLNQLALAHLKLPEKTSLTYSFRYRVSVNYRQSDSLFIILDVKTLDVKGDKQIRDFNIEKLLEPSGYDVSFSLRDPVRGVIMQDRKGIIMDDGLVQIASFPDSLWSAGVDISLKINDIDFTGQDYRKLELELAAIRDYYSSASLGDTLLKKIQNQRKNPGEFEEIIKLYTTGIKGLYLLKQSLDVSSEIVPGKDPLKVEAKNKIMAYNLEEFVDYILQSRKALLKGDVYDRFAAAYIESLKEANKLSQSVDYYSSPFYYRLYSNSITVEQLKEAAHLFEKEVTRRIHKSIDFNKLTRELMRAYLRENDALISEHRFLEAVDLLTGAVKILELSPFEQNSGDVQQALVLARQGLIASYIGIMQKALDKNLISLAEKYLAEVEKYTIKYNLTKEETGPFKEIYIRMAGTYVQLGNIALNKNEYGVALDYFTKATSLLEGNSGSLKERAENGRQIAVRSQYDLIIKWVNILVGQGNYEEADKELTKAEQFAKEYPDFYPDKWEVYVLTYKIAELHYTAMMNELIQYTKLPATPQRIEKLALANEMYQKFQFPEYSKLDTLLSNMGIGYLNSLFSRGRLKHWASEPDSALSLANEAFSLSARLSLNNNIRIKEQYKELVELASETYCNKARGEYNSLINEASELFKANKFALARQKTTMARELVYQKSNCGLTTAAINKMLSQYQHQIKWDEMVTEAFRLLNEKKFQASANLIQQAESIYTYYKLDTTGLANIGYYDLAIKSDDKEMLRHAISHQAGRGKPDQALDLLERLRLIGCAAEETVDLQENLARIVAIRDKNETPNLNIKVMLETYTGGNKWYSRFENVYRYYTKPLK